ncbi:MAG TPA: hypothetical protein VJT13_18355 [Xanthobacteraceae bacterium]|nr:hypothetical protein [Xanthobacteraceae bacterium]
MAKVRLTLSVSDSHLKKLGTVAKAAAKAGMKVEQTHKTLGVLSGSIDAGKVEKLRAIDGVDRVEEERTFQLPPPGSPVQ